nr:pyrophosphatase [Tanacetum cinerariifolium]
YTLIEQGGPKEDLCMIAFQPQGVSVWEGAEAIHLQAEETKPAQEKETKQTLMEFPQQEQVKEKQEMVKKCTKCAAAVAALGMLTTIAIGQAIDAYGPISDDDGDISKMAGVIHRIRERTNALDAVEKTTTAIGKVVYY